MGKETIDVNEIAIHKLKSLRVAFNEKNFLLIFNAEKKDGSDGYMVSIPVERMYEIVEGFYASGLGYQKNFGKSIGFDEKEV